MKKTYLVAQLTLLLNYMGTQTMETPQTNIKQNQTKLMEMSSAFILSRVIHVAAEIKIADLLVDGPQNIAVLAQKSNMNENALYRLLRLLASYGIFNHDQSNNFSLTPLAEQLVSTDPHSLWAWMTYHNGANRWTAYGDMKYSIETGKPSFDHIFGKGYFDFLSDNPILAQQFDEGMKNLSEGENSHIASSYDFTPYHTIMDIGGGTGGLVTEIIIKDADTLTHKGIIFDLPYVETSAQEYLKDMNVCDHITFTQSTGFFEIPHGTDLYILKRILHDWNDADSVTILKNCYHAMQTNSRLLIMEAIVSQENVRDFKKDIDMAMLVLFGGKERTKTEWLHLLEQADLELVNIYETPSLLSIIEVQKKQ